MPVIEELKRVDRSCQVEAIAERETIITFRESSEVRAEGVIMIHHRVARGTKSTD
jgi:hypothetical protein